MLSLRGSLDTACAAVLTVAAAPLSAALFDSYIPVILILDGCLRPIALTPLCGAGRTVYEHISFILTIVMMKRKAAGSVQNSTTFPNTF